MCRLPRRTLEKEMEIRFLNPDDAGEWLRLRIEALRGDPEAFSASLEEYESLTIEEVKRRLWSSADAFVTGAFDNGRLQGVAGFFRDKGTKTRHKGHIWGVYVTPNVRGMGVGRKLVNRLLERAAAVAGVEGAALGLSGPASGNPALSFSGISSPTAASHVP